MEDTKETEIVLEDAEKRVFVNVNIPALKCTAHAMAKVDIRYYLMGVLVEATPTETILVATDGHRMLITRREEMNGIDEPVRFIIPADIVRLMTSGSVYRQKELQTIEVTKSGDGKWSTPIMSINGMPNLEFREIAGKFPDWRRVVPPAKEEVEPGFVNFVPSYLNDFEKAAAALCGRKRKTPSLTVTKHNKARGLVTVHLESPDDTGFLGIIMGFRYREGSTVIPDWAQPKQEKAEEDLLQES